MNSPLTKNLDCPTTDQCGLVWLKKTGMGIQRFLSVYLCVHSLFSRVTWSDLRIRSYELEVSNKLGVVTHAFNPRGRQISEFETILVYTVSSRITRGIQRNPVSIPQQKTYKPARLFESSRASNLVSQLV